MFRHYDLHNAQWFIEYKKAYCMCIGIFFYCMLMNLYFYIQNQNGFNKVVITTNYTLFNSLPPEKKNSVKKATWN